VTKAQAQEIAIIPPTPSAETMVGVSPVIFTGIVSGLRYDRHANSEMPFTFVRFAGVKYLRKDSEVATEKGDSIEISLAGGIRDNLRTMEVDELPQFKLGQRYLVFLRGGGWRFSPVTGFEAGVFRLHGRLEDDAVILNYRGIPLGGVRDGRFVPASRVKDERLGRDDSERGVRESELSPEAEKELRERSDRFKDEAAREQLEKELRERERKEVQEKINKENDQSSGQIAGYDNVMRLSQMKSFIDRSVKATSGQYKEFSTLYLTPVGFSKEGFTVRPPQNP
jgi:hypothetical protein